MLLQNTTSKEPTISLMLNYGPLGMIRATQKVISENCIVVDTGRIDLNDHSEVEIVLSIRVGGASKTYRIPATVSGKAEHGVKLLFRECAKATVEALLPFVTPDGTTDTAMSPG